MTDNEKMKDGLRTVIRHALSSAHTQVFLAHQALYALPWGEQDSASMSDDGEAMRMVMDLLTDMIRIARDNRSVVENSEEMIDSGHDGLLA